MDGRSCALTRDVGCMETRCRGLRRGNGLCPLWRPEYTPSNIPTATWTVNGRRSYEAQVRITQSLWFLLAQATTGSAATIVARCAQDERPVQLLPLKSRRRDRRCNSTGESLGFIVKLDTICGKFDSLRDGKADETKRTALLVGIKGALPQVCIQLTTQPGMS